MPLDRKLGYIKSRIPKELWSEAKSVAALMEITMTDFFINAVKVYITQCNKMLTQRSMTSMSKE
jgi:hypothetical protein